MLKSLLIAFPAIILLTALSTPFVYTSLAYIFDGISYPFSRIFDRVAMFWIVAGLIVFRKKIFFNESKGFKFAFRDIFSSLKVLFGFSLPPLIASFFITLVLFYQDIFELREKHDLSFVITKILSLLVTAYFVSILEELFFRYLIISEYIKNNQVVRGIIISSVFYAFCHFITPIYEFKYTAFDAGAGLRYIFEISKRFLILEVYRGVIGLFLVGMVLAIAFYRSGKLTISVGLHAGWIASLKLIFLFVALPASYQMNLALTRRYVLVAHPYTWVSIILILLFVIWFTKDNKKLESIPEKIA